MSASRFHPIGPIIRRFRWLLASLGLLLAAYTAAGFLLVPYLARSSIESYVQQDLGRKIAIGKISFNPFTFTTEVTGFALREADDALIASFDLLRVNFQLSSIFNRAWTFREVRLDNPSVQLVIAADGSINLTKLAPAADPSQAPVTPAGVPAIRIGTFAVSNGRMGFEDRNRTRPFMTTLTPIEFALTDFRTAPDFQNVYRFQATSEAGERLAWSGQFSVQPLGSTGQFTIADLKAATIADYLQDALPFDLPSGALDLEGEYRATVSDTLGLTVDLPSLRLRDVAIAPKGGAAGEPWISLPAVEISRTSLSLAERKLTVERIQADNAKLSVWREPDGQVNLLQLVPQNTAATPAAAVPAATTPAAAWSLAVGTVDIRGAGIEAEDRMMRPAAKLSLTPVNVTVAGFSTAPGATLNVNASLGVGGGRVAAQGDLKLAPLTANFAVDVADFELPPLQPYIAAVAALQLTSGAVSTKGDFRMAAEPAEGEPGMQFTGDIAIANLATRDNAVRQDFIKWQSLALTGIDYRQGPDRLSIERIEASQPYGRVIVNPDQTLNIAAVLSPGGPAEAAPSAQPAAALAPTAGAAAAPAMPIRIGTVRIVGGSADFADYFVQPNFSATLLELDGTVTGLSSTPNSRAEVKIAGKVDRYAPVEISGQVNLLSAAVFTDLALDFNNMELTTFNPYSGKYAGYNISKGKLTTELRYKVENRKLDAQHHIVLDQLEFGAATNSKDAVPLPVRLAVALLKDRNGVIDLSLPVTGSLDDPQFRVGPIIWQAFVGLLTKIVTAPFALLGSLFGGGEELSFVDFTVGSAALTPELEGKISNLAKALAERPQLQLDIPLQTISTADEAALAHVALEAALAPLMPPPDPATPAGPAARLAALDQLYQQQMGAMPAYPMPEAPVAGVAEAAPEVPDAEITEARILFLEEALQPKFTASETARAQLARARAEAVRAAVLANPEIMPERVFLTERQSGAMSPDGTTRMELTLQ